MAKRKKRKKREKAELARVEDEEEESPLARLITELGGLGRGIGGLVMEDMVGGQEVGGVSSPPVKFNRQAGVVKKIVIGRDGKPLRIEIEPEEWPPRRRQGETY